jgi:hypothetical protein
MSARDEGSPGEPSRLLDDPEIAADPSANWALGLLRGAEPYRAPAGKKQRVQLRLGHTRRRRAPLLLLVRLAVVAIVLFGGAAIVSAAFGRWPAWMARAYERVAGKPPAGDGGAPARARGPRPVARHAPAPPVAPAPSEIASPAAESPAPAPAAPIAVAPAIRAAAAAPRARRPSAPALQPPGEDASTVSAAMRALRVEHNPVRARVLLARYLGEHPNGNLAEEALAMTIEAALAHRDADVGALAARYLRLYPQGSFAALARNARVAQQQAPDLQDQDQ